MTKHIDTSKLLPEICVHCRAFNANKRCGCLPARRARGENPKTKWIDGEEWIVPDLSEIENVELFF